MPSSHLILCHPLLLLPPISPSIGVFSNESTLRMRWPKYWSFSFSISPSNEHPWLISFRMAWLDLLAVQGTLKKTLNSQRKLEKEEWNWRNQPAWLQTILQSHSHQNSMVLAQRQKYRSMEQNRKPRDKSRYLWTPYLWQRRQEYTVEKRQPL